jgi:hypothetical protein
VIAARPVWGDHGVYGVNLLARIDELRIATWAL